MMRAEVSGAERQRVERQVALDGERSAKERNLWGQFATPQPLAQDITRYALSLHAGPEVRFVEPSCGSGSFFSALLHTLPAKSRVAAATGFELDPRFARAATELWAPHGLSVVEGDYTLSPRVAGQDATLLLANPPYVRHHHLDSETKKVLLGRVHDLVGIKPSGLSGLYLYFVLLSHAALAPGAISAWLIPTEFMDVNYGRALKEYLTTKVTLRRIHKFDPSDVQFDDALVTSAVVVFENVPPAASSTAELTHGGTVSAPRERRRVPISELRPGRKWREHFRADAASTESGPVLSDFFKIRRGIATGANSFFILAREDALGRGFSPAHLKPILPSPRGMKQRVIEADADGYPAMAGQLVVIDTDKDLEQLRAEDPKLADYLAGVDPKIRNGYLISKRKPWYKQEVRQPAPILCTYMGRGVDEKHPFSFLLNRSDALVTNVYLMLYPTPLLDRYLSADPHGLAKVYQALCELTAEDLRNGGRVYGGGLHKMEPAELAALRATKLDEIVRPGA